MWFIAPSEAIRVDMTGEAARMRLEKAKATSDRGMNALLGYFAKSEVGFEPEPFVSWVLEV